MADLTGKVALVTGAASGIGAASALAFADAGAKVAVCDRDLAGAEATAKLIGDGGADACAVAVDVTDAAQVQAMVDEVVGRFGRLDCAHNNAGITGPAALTADYDAAQWELVLAVNLTGVFHCLRHELAAMLRAGGGAIVNTASFSGLVAVPRIPAYVASKHGVVGLTKAAAVEYGRKGIRVNAVCPGSTRTPMVDGFSGGDPRVEEAMAAASPMRRLAEPEEIARTVVWLCSDEASFVNGHALAVDGGAVIQ
ncbi:MAG: SDR family oxidoreductase [Actinomycetota bacterium]|nr:SDR family oxidoreductase [Actinomycetota bacterium]